MNTETKQSTKRPENTIREARNYGDTKETIGALTLVVCRGGQIHEPITVRYYKGRSSSATVVYCSVWIRDTRGGEEYNATGKAKGYGFDRPSAALQDALENAGFVFSREFGGEGPQAAREAVLVVANALGWGPLDLRRIISFGIA